MTEETKAVATIKNGAKTTELWVGVISTLLLAFWPHFPQEAFLAIVTWIVGRSSQKMFGFVDPASGKAAWQTSEFWLSVGYAVVVSIFPDIPAESLYATQGWVVARTGIKIAQERKVLKASADSK